MSVENDRNNLEQLAAISSQEAERFKRIAGENPARHVPAIGPVSPRGRVASTGTVDGRCNNKFERTADQA